MPLFGQDLFEQAEKTKGLDDPDYKKARETSLRLAGAEGIDRMLREYDVVALVGPTMPAAWTIDAVHGDQYPGGGGGSLAAVAGYPHLTVPMGAVEGLPVGLSFIGPKWSDGMILSLGYAYEQASRDGSSRASCRRSRRARSRAASAAGGALAHSFAFLRFTGRRAPGFERRASAQCRIASASS